MDLRTANLLDALAHPGGAILAALLAGDATEAELSARVAAAQPTVHRRLRRFEDLGVVTRAPGQWRTPNRTYQLATPRQADALLTAAAALAAALARQEQLARAEMLDQLRRGRRSRSSLRRAL